MDNFLDTYRKLSHETLHLLDTIYDHEIHFIDPVHEIKGLSPLKNYFSRLYENIDRIDFLFLNPVRVGNEGYVHWEMRYAHPKIGRGRDITVPGASFVTFAKDDKVRYHRDFFDLGSMVYQHLPVLGTIVKTVNRRIGS